MPIDGMDKLQKRLKDLQDKLRRMDGIHNAKEILTSDWLRRNTRFGSVDQLERDFQKAKADPKAGSLTLDAFIKKNSKFPDAKAMMSAAGKDWIEKELKA